MKMKTAECLLSWCLHGDIRVGDETRTFPTFEARCAECDALFGAPFLGDFAYGEFILTGSRGTAFSHLSAIGHSVWDYISSVIAETHPDALPEVVARLADPVDDQPLTGSHVCPKCGSTHWADWGGVKRGFVDISPATFEALLSLPPEDRRQRVLNVLNEVTRNG